RLVRGLHVLGGHVRVDLRRRQVLVTEELLDEAQVRAAIEEVGREAVPEGVRRGLLAQPGDLDVLVEDLSNASRREAIAEAIQEERVGIFLVDPRHLRADLDETLDRRQGEASDRHDPLASALAARLDHLGREIDVADVERGELAHAQPGRVERLEDRAVTDRLERIALWRVEQALDLVGRQEVRELLLDLRRLDVLHRIGLQVALANEELVEAPDRRELANDRRLLIVLRAKLGEELAHLEGRDLRRVDAATVSCEEAKELV